MSQSLLSNAPWQSPERLQLPAAIGDWLLDAGSLTERLRQHTQAFNVQVRHHGPAAVEPDESAQLSSGQSYQVREVILQAAQTPWVFARSLIPDTEQGAAGNLHQIGSQPLGEALFTHPDVQVGAFQVAHFAPHSEIGKLNQRLGGPPQTLWGRRRVFTLDAQQVLVAEIFLAQAPCYDSV